MRWQNLEVGREDERRLPSLGADAVVRTFDAPEALDIRFHEVRARSALNRVPAKSRMPFRWTINPYRGCSHACLYCMGGDTPVLTADGRTRALADLTPGDSIYGTVRQGNYRRYAITQVLDHWSTIKPAYRITLHDGTELVASGDHRFLSDRGWKHVTGTQCGSRRRPHLTLNNKLMGTGRVAEGPCHSAGYRRGYLCGVIRGDGHIGSYSYERVGRTRNDVHRFRLALTDLEAVRRAREYLAGIEIATDEFVFQAAAVGRRSMSAIRTSARSRVDAIRDVIEWPRVDDEDWLKGFLAGIFDAEGSYGGVIRFANTDAEIIGWITHSLGRLGFRHVVERSSRGNGMAYVRVTGGLVENLRFFHTVDPAISRKRSIEGRAIKTNAALGVASIEPLGMSPLYDITTGTGDFIANGVVSHNCFARPTHTFLDLDAGRDFEREIVVKVNAPELARAELSRPSWKHEQVALGTNTDPYQWVESRYELMPGIWEALLDSDTPCSLVTKSPLALRDIDILSALAAGPGVSVYFSVPTLDEKAWRETEPHTPSPRARLDAVRTMNDAGVPCGILVAPVIPGVNDAPEQVGEILRIAHEHGAIGAPVMPLHLRGEVREIWFGWLRHYRPDLIERHEELYRRGAYVPADERRRIQAVADSVRPRGAGRRRRPRSRATTERGRERSAAPAPTRPAQDSLF